MVAACDSRNGSRAITRIVLKNGEDQMTKGTQDRPRDWMRHSRLKGLVAIVVGAGSSIGEETARIIAANEGIVCGGRRYS